MGRVWRVSEENLAAFIERNGRNDEDEEELSAEDLAAVRRGLEDLKAGRFVTLEEYEQGRLTPAYRSHSTDSLSPALSGLFGLP